MEKYKVTKKSFLDWFYGNRDRYWNSEMAYAVIKELKDKGVYTLTVKDVWDRCEYIPTSICEGEIDSILAPPIPEEYLMDDRELLIEYCELI